MSQHAEFFPCPHVTIPCDVFNCRQRAKWFIGRSDGPVSATWKVCDDCARHLVQTAPEEFGAVPAASSSEPRVVLELAYDNQQEKELLESLRGAELKQVVISGKRVLVIVNPDDVIDLDATLSDPDNVPVPPSEDYVPAESEINDAAIESETTGNSQPDLVDSDGDGVQEFQCEQCDRTFKTHRGLLTHIGQVHGE